MRPAWLEIDLSAIKSNTRAFCRLCGPNAGVCAVVKGNAYGHGAVPVAKAALDAGAAWLGVAMVQEAAELRDAGIQAPILILGESSPDEADAILDARAVPAVATIETARALSDAAQRRSTAAEVHIKVDSGMGRQGVRLDALGRLLQSLADLPALRVTGIFTHFAVAESDPDFTRWQHENFMRGVQMAEAILGPIPVKHCSNTAASILYPDMRHSFVRPGAGIYGLNPGMPPDRFPDLRRALSLRARIALVKNLKPGDSVGYGRAWKAPGPRTVALLPLGYCDGYPRALSNNAEVLVRGQRVPVVGRISMDVTVVDVTDVGPVHVGEEAVLIGRQGREEITVEELAKRAGTIVQEIVSRLSIRLPRLYTGGCC